MGCTGVLVPDWRIHMTPQDGFLQHNGALSLCFSTGRGTVFHLFRNCTGMGWQRGPWGVTKAKRTKSSMDHIPYDRQAGHVL